MAPMDRGKQKPWNEMSDEQRAEWALRMEIYAAQGHTDFVLLGGYMIDAP